MTDLRTAIEQLMIGGSINDRTSAVDPLLAQGTASEAGDGSLVVQGSLDLYGDGPRPVRVLFTASALAVQSDEEVLVVASNLVTDAHEQLSMEDPPTTRTTVIEVTLR